MFVVVKRRASIIRSHHFYAPLSFFYIKCRIVIYKSRRPILNNFSLDKQNWWKGKPPGSIACTRQQQPRFYYCRFYKPCSDVYMPQLLYNCTTVVMTMMLSFCYDCCHGETFMITVASNRWHIQCNSLLPFMPYARVCLPFGDILKMRKSARYEVPWEFPGGTMNTNEGETSSSLAYFIFKPAYCMRCYCCHAYCVLFNNKIKLFWFHYIKKTDNACP